MNWTRRGKRRMLFLLALVVMGGISFVAYKQVRRIAHEGRIQEARAAGLEAYERGDYADALKDLSTAAGANKQDVPVLLAFADARMRVPSEDGNHVRQVIALYNAVLRVEPQNREALDGVLVIYQRARFDVELADIANRLLEMDPDHVEALSVTAFLAQRDQRADDADAALERLMQLEPHALSWRAAWIEFHIDRGMEREEILAQCQTWIDEHGNATDGRFHLLAAQMNGSYGRVEEARDYARQAAERGATEPVVLERMVTFLDRVGLSSEADDLLAEAHVAFDSTGWIYAADLLRRWKAGRLAEAKDIVEDARATLDPLPADIIRWSCLLAMVERDEETFGEVAAELRTRAEDAEEARERDRLRAWADLMANVMADGSLDDRAELCWTLRRLDPGDPIPLEILARVQQEHGEHDVAIELLRDARRLAPDWTALSLSEARSLLVLDRPRDAFGQLQSLIENGRGSDAAFLMLARAWLDLGPDAADVKANVLDPETGATVESGLVAYLELIAEQTQDPQVAPMLLEAYVRSGREPEAIAFVRGVIDDPESLPAPAIIALADACRRWNPDLALGLMQAGGGANGDARSILVHAEILHGQGNTDEALALLDGADDDGGLLKWTRARMIVESGNTIASASLVQLAEGETDAQRLLAMLRYDSIWNDEEVVSALLDRIETLLGEGSSQLQLARARLVLLHQADSDKEIAASVAALEELLARDPDSKQALELYAQLIMTGLDDESSEALSHLRRVVTLYPNDLRNYARLARLLKRRGETDEALRYIEEMVRRAGTLYDYHRLSARWYEELGELDRAEAVLESIDERHRIEVDHLALARHAARKRDDVKAGALYAKLLESPTPATDTVVAAAKFYAARGRNEDAQSVLVWLTDPGERALAEAQVLTRSGSHALARDRLEQATQALPGRAEPWDELANAYVRDGDFEEGVNALLRALEAQSDYVAARTKLVLVAFELDAAGRQRVASRAATTLDADDPLIPTLALVARSADDSSPAVRAEAVTLTEQHDNELGVWWCAIALHAAAANGETVAAQRETAAKQYDDAAAHEKAAAELHDTTAELAVRAAQQFAGEPVPAEWAANMLVSAGRLQDAYDMARRWRRLSMESTERPDLLIAALALDLDRPRDAYRQLIPYAAQLRADPDQNEREYLMWLQAMLRDEQPIAYRSEISNLLAAHPDWASRLVGLTPELEPTEVNYVLGMVEPILGADDAGLLRLASAFHQAAERTGEDAQYEHALRLTARIREAGPVWHDALLLRASIFSARGNAGEAESLYRTALSQNPESPRALNNLAYLLVRENLDCHEAVTLAQAAVRASDGHPAALDTLAQAYLCVGSPEDAEPHIDRAIAAVPDDLGLKVTHAQVTLALGRGADARREFEQIRRDERDAELTKRLDTLEQSLRAAGV